MAEAVRHHRIHSHAPAPPQNKNEGIFGIPKLVKILPRLSLARPLHSVFDLTRSFLSSGEPSTDISLFEFRSLPPPVSSPLFSPSLSFRELESAIKLESPRESPLLPCLGEDRWLGGAADSEARLAKLKALVAGIPSLLAHAPAKRPGKAAAVGEANKAKLERAVAAAVAVALPAGQRDEALVKE